MKNSHLNLWLWKWHMLAGLVCLPFMLLLAITGIIYLFKADFNDALYSDVKYVQAKKAVEKVSFNQQLASVEAFSDKPVVKLYLSDKPISDNLRAAAAFQVKGQGRARDMVYVNPYTGVVTGQVMQKETLMYKVRKLHGELLLSKPGTYVVELVASWFLVLLLTGMYIWWPKKRFAGAGFFTIRRHLGKRTLLRDTHAVLGFWLSLFMLVILVGGLPWTDLFGHNYKWLQKQTDSGFPATWHAGVKSERQSDLSVKGLSIDEMVAVASAQQLPGKISISLPQKSDDAFVVTNESFWLSDQKALHFDQFSGELLKAHNWQDVGLMRDIRLMVMRLHQGEYGKLNWYGVLIVSSLFTLALVAGIWSYLLRKPAGGLGIVRVPDSFKVTFGLKVLIVALMVLLPMFAISVVLVVLYQMFTSNKESAVLTAP